MSKKRNAERSVDAYREFLNFLTDNSKAAGVDVDWSKSATNLKNSERMEYGLGMTTADIQSFIANQISAQKQMDFQKDMSSTQWQRGVADMQAAGLNPALAYSQGGSAAPSGASAQANATVTGRSAMLGFLGEMIGNLKEMALLPWEIKAKKAEIENTKADTANLNVRTAGEELRNDYQSMVNDYYPKMSDATIQQIWTNIAGTNADIDLKQVNTKIADADRILKEAEAKFAGEFASLKKSFLSAQTNAQQEAAAASAARAACDRIEANYMQANGMKMGSNDYIALVTAICAWLGTTPGDVVNTITETVQNWFKPKGETVTETGRDKDGNYYEVRDKN